MSIGMFSKLINRESRINDVFRSLSIIPYFIIPLINRNGVCDSKPITVNFEIRRLTAGLRTSITYPVKGYFEVREGSYGDILCGKEE